MVKRLRNDFVEITPESTASQDARAIDLESALTVWDLRRLTPADQRVFVECVFAKVRADRVGITGYELRDDVEQSKAA